MRILIADDDKALRIALFDALNHTDEREFDLVSDGKAAYALLKSINYDLVIIDMLMPGMRGDEVIEMSSIWNFTREANIIVITGYDPNKVPQNDSIIKALQKPFDAQEILDIIELKSKENEDGQD